MEHAQSTIPADECFRCGYNLFGIANENACPECGLLAERSRRVSDELHNTRPKWLRNISWGVNLILLSIPTAAIGILVYARYTQYQYGTNLRYLMMPLNNLCVATGMSVLTDWLDALLRGGGWLSYLGLPFMPHAGFLMSEIMLLAGGFFLSRPEGYKPADREDRRLRLSLLLISMSLLFLTLLSVGFNVLSAFMVSQIRPSLAWIGPGIPRAAMPQPTGFYGYWLLHEETIQDILTILFYVLFGIALVILPLLLFYRLRGLAKRARSAHLAEHCAIVGIGTAATAVVTIIATATFLYFYGDTWNNHWIQSSAALITSTLLLTPVLLFPLWSLYLLTCFAISFRRAAREMSRKWKAGDRAIATNDPTNPA